MNSWTDSTPTLSKSVSGSLIAAVIGASALTHFPASAADIVAQRAPVAIIVRVPKPWYAPRFAIVRKMRETIDQYASAPGLAFKAYSFEHQSSDYGGIYLWRDRSSAQAWFNKEWFERVRRERGSEAYVRMFDVPVVIDNTPGGTPADEESAAVATLIEIQIPAGLSREQIIEGFREAVPTYQKVPGLLRKYFAISEQGTFGGIYLWKDEASANAWFNKAWMERVRNTYGQSAKIEWFETPILTHSKDGNNALSTAVYIEAQP